MEKQPLLDEPEQAAEPELSLSELQQNVRKAQQAYWKAWSKTTSGTWHKRIMLIVSTIVTAFFLLCLLAIIDDAWNDDYDYDDGWRYRGKVPLEIHIMSKCPDARVKQKMRAPDGDTVINEERREKMKEQAKTLLEGRARWKPAPVNAGVGRMLSQR